MRRELPAAGYPLPASGLAAGSRQRVVWAVLALLAAGCAPPAVRSPAGERATEPAIVWMKGNLHTHSLWSDGNDFPEMILDWYDRNGYDFVTLSDHNTLAEGERWVPVPEGSARMEMYRRYRERFGPEWVAERRVNDTLQVRLKTYQEYQAYPGRGKLLVIQGEEISDVFQRKPLHLNATNVVEKIEPRGGNSVTEVMQNNINAVNEQRARTGRAMFPHLNHPNFYWAVRVEDMLPLEGERFFEVYNGHPLVHNEGDHLHPGTEQMWDILLAYRLSQGREVMYGLATDDAHNYHTFDSTTPNPGRGWVMVRTPHASTDSIIAAMERGDFYSTNGVRLRDYGTDGRRIAIVIEPEPGVVYTTRFIGTRRGFDPSSTAVLDSAGNEVSRRYSHDVGEVLGETLGPVAIYEIEGDEIYVRAKITSSKPKANPYREGEVEVAWTQPWVLRRDTAAVR